MKKISVLILVALLISLFAMTASAESKDLVVDNADLLTDGEEAALEEYLSQIGDKWDYDIVIYTVDHIGPYPAHIYAEEFFDGNGYGRGENKDGAILLVSMAERDWGVFGTEMSSSDAESIGEDIVSYLSRGDYYRAFIAFADEVDDFKSFPLFSNLIIFLIIGFVVAIITVSVMKGKLKSVRMAANAKEYVRRDSFKLNHSRDLYLYSTVTRVARPKNNSSGGHGGGGSRGGGASGKF